MKIITKEDYNILSPIIDKGDRLIDGAMSVWDGVTDDWTIWEPVFDQIFSEEMSDKIYEILKNFNPYIPDTTYQEDVCAFWYAFKREMQEVIIV